MKLAVLLSLGMGALAASAGSWFLLGTDDPAPKRARQVEQRIEPTKASSPAPLYERRTLTRTIGPPAAAPTPAEPIAEAPSDEAPSIEETRVHLENQFDAERGRSALRRLETVVTNSAARVAVPGSQLRKVECRDSLCRMDLEFDNPDVDQQFFHKLSRLDDRSEDTNYLHSFDIVIMNRTTSADGKVQAQAYLKRPTGAQ